MIHLFWDIDGTLLTTARAGIFALEEACEEVLGERIDLATMRTAGLTDAEIARVLCESRGAGGAFSEAGSDRPSIARRARELAGNPPGKRMVVIGDTPHDVSCGKAIGARTLAVASGPSYDLPALEACAPDLAVEALPAPSDFLPLLGVDGSAL